MYDEDDLLPLSGLQHLTFCERRWALVQIEGQWEENRFTSEGRVLHERAHSSEIESRPGVLIRRTLPLRSFRLGISGQADIVEFESVPSAGSGIPLPDRKGYWQPFPIEYKRSKDRASGAYSVQLCAQAICLEEMLGVPVPAGAVFDGGTRRRKAVEFTTELRRTVEHAAVRMHELYAARATPPAVYGKKCESCSLIEQCMPRMSDQRRDVGRYLAAAVRSAAAEAEEGGT
jgi:CRISPR-associated exonuclease Cas4